jgi:hypothetical protein
MADYASSKHSSGRHVILIYIDPGAGSMVIQAALAAALAIPFFFRTHIGRVVQRLRGTRGERDESQAPRD